MTSNWEGARTSCMAALSTYIRSSSTWGYSPTTAQTAFLHSRELYSTLALSTEVTHCAACGQF
jgi:hypothetical protein